MGCTRANFSCLKCEQIIQFKSWPCEIKRNSNLLFLFYFVDVANSEMNKLVEMVTINSATILHYSSLLHCLVKIVTLQCNGHSHSLCLGLYSHLDHPGGDNDDDDDGEDVFFLLDR